MKKMFEKSKLIKEIKEQEKEITEYRIRVAKYQDEEDSWRRRERGLKEHTASLEKKIEFLKKKNDEFLKGTERDGIEYEIMNYAWDEGWAVTLPRGATILGVQDNPFSEPDEFRWTIKCLIKKNKKKIKEK